MTMTPEERSALTEVAQSAVTDLDAVLLIRNVEQRRAAIRALFDENISWIRRRALVEAAIELIVIMRSR